MARTLLESVCNVVGRPLRSLPKGYSPHALIGAFLRDVQVKAETRIVKRRIDQQARMWIPTPESEHYSVIDRLLARTVGMPRVLQQRETRGKKCQS